MSKFASLSFCLLLLSLAASHASGQSNYATLGGTVFDPQHKVFLDLLPGALNRPPLAVGGIYWDALTQAQGAVELNTKQPADALAEVQSTVQPRLDEVGC